LKSEKVFKFAVIALGPEVVSALAIDYLDVDAYPVGIALKAAFKQIAHPQ